MIKPERISSATRAFLRDNAAIWVNSESERTGTAGAYLVFRIPPGGDDALLNIKQDLDAANITQSRGGSESDGRTKYSHGVTRWSGENLGTTDDYYSASLAFDRRGSSFGRLVATAQELLGRIKQAPDLDQTVALVEESLALQ